MEDITLYSSLKKSLSSIPAKYLNFSSRIILSHLDLKQVLPAGSGYARDYRGLGELMNFQHCTVKIFENGGGPTEKILDSWTTQSDATLEKLIEFLEKMERHDIIKELTPSLERTAKSYVESQKLQEIPIQDPEVSSCPVSMHFERDVQVFTPDDLKTGEITYYDAYVSYADEDSKFVQDLAKILESPEIGLKLFIRGRDLLAGYAEHDTNIRLIKERCRRMLIILSPNFLNSPACEFQASFATGLAIDQKQRMLIPIVLESCKTPLILKYVSKIDFTKPDVYEWVWGKLISSLLPEDRHLMFTPSVERVLQSAPKPASLASTKVNPMITYPPTTKQLSSSANNSVISVNPMITYPPTTKQLSSSANNSVISVSSIVSSDTVSTNALKTSTVPSKASNAPRKWRFPWSANLKGRLYSSNHSVSSSSSATSGFHSQSGNTFNNLESSVEDCSSDTPV